jgi:hypothetical protein
MSRVVGPRPLPQFGEVLVWIDTGNGPGYTRREPVQRLTLAPDDDGQGPAAIYDLQPPVLPVLADD